MKHTKGHWAINEGQIFKDLQGKLHIPIETPNQIICTVHGDNAIANAKLIAASLDLLKQVIELTECIKSMVGGSDPLYLEDYQKEINEAEAVIKKATE